MRIFTGSPPSVWDYASQPMAAGSNVRDVAPPRAEPDGGGGGWAWLVTARDAVEAELIRGLLEADGIAAVLDARDPSPGAWMFLSGDPNAPVRVLVPRALLDDARLSLLEASAAAPPTPPAAAATARRSTAWAIAITVVVVVLYLAAVFRAAVAMLIRDILP